MEHLIAYYDPRTRQLLGKESITSSIELNTMLQLAAQSLVDWGSLSHTERADCIDNAVTILKKSLPKLIAAEAADTGKPLQVAEAELIDGLKIWQYAASLARQHTSVSTPIGDAEGRCEYFPVGVVAMILPWNYPFITAAERLPFALAAGCPVVIKPSEKARGALTLMSHELNEHNVFPKGTLQLTYGPGEILCPMLAQHPAVEMFAYVGSTNVGKKLASLALQHGKRFKGEMGGNNFVLVYPGVDISQVAESIITNGFRNAGQACIAGTHVLVVPELAQALTEQLTVKLDQFYTEQEQLDLQQPMITPEKAIAASATIKGAIERGADCIGQQAINECWCAPIILNNVALSDPIMFGEIFAPIITISACDKNMFLPTVHRSEYGLALYIWTPDRALQRQLIHVAKVGRIWINCENTIWDPHLPAGGLGLSGTDREMGQHAIQHYSISKSIVIGEDV